MPKLKLKSFEILWDAIPVNSYLRDIPAVRSLEKMEFRSNITLFCGENGTGKSTVLRGLAEAWGLNPGGGTKNYSAEESQRQMLGYHLKMNKGDASCYRCFYRSDSFLQTTREMEEFWRDAGLPASYGDRPIDDLSHGEGFRAFLETLRPNGLYFLDEPDGAFSVQNQLALMCRIMDLTESGAQFIIVTHSPVLLGLPDAEIYHFSDKGVFLCEYEDTDAYQITKAFLNNRKTFLHHFRNA